MFNLLMYIFVHYSSEKVSMEQSIINKFIEKFQLTKNEMEILKQSDISSDFFYVLEKTYVINNNCQILIQSGNQSLAFSIMEQMSSLQV